MNKLREGKQSKDTSDKCVTVLTVDTSKAILIKLYVHNPRKHIYETWSMCQETRHPLDAVPAHLLGSWEYKTLQHKTGIHANADI